MIQIDSSLEGKQFALFELERLLKPKGFVIGGNWDYDHGAFDYKMANDDGYQFLRIPFTAASGQLDVKGTTVKIGKPYVLHHVYQEGIDPTAQVSNATAAINQFQEPQDKDGTVAKQYIELGTELVREVENTLLTSS